MAPRDPISLKRLTILTDGDDQDGRLVLVDGKLAAVFARLDSTAHAPEQRGRWHLEAGFGPCESIGRALLFSTLGDAVRWVEARVDPESGAGLSTRPRIDAGRSDAG